MSLSLIEAICNVVVILASVAAVAGVALRLANERRPFMKA